MIVKRSVFFIVLLFVVVLPYFAVRFIWVATAKQTQGKVAFIGKDISAQIPRSYSVIMFSATGKDTIFFNSTDGELLEAGEKVMVLYQPAKPEDASIKSFMSLWLDASVYGVIMFVIITIIFLHPEIVPYKSRIKLQLRKPVISVV